MSVAPQRAKSSATVDFPAAMLPVSATLSIVGGLEERRLVLVPPRYLVAVSAARLVALAAAHHDGRRVVARRFPVEEALIPAGRVAADDADGLQLVDDFRDGHELAHRAERLAAEIGVRAGQDHAHAAARERRGDSDDVRIQKLGLVDGDELRLGPDQAEDLGG